MYDVRYAGEYSAHAYTYAAEECFLKTLPSGSLNRREVIDTTTTKHTFNTHTHTRCDEHKNWKKCRKVEVLYAFLFIATNSGDGYKCVLRALSFSVRKT